jgi:endonuclease III
MQRADRFEQLYKALKKHYKPVTPVSDRKVLDHLLYACCLQDATYEAADEAFAKLQQAYFDSNEIRVTTIAELSESLTSLPHASAAANRIKKLLQGMFESRYSFDIDDLKKANLGKAIDEISGWVGVTKFMVSYVTQHAFGGHAIPVDESTLTVCHLLDLITPSEIEKATLPGVERAIAKNKGIEFATLLHQFAVDHAASHKNPSVIAVFKELGMASKPKAPPPPAAPTKVAAPAKSDGKPATKGIKAKSEPTAATASTTLSSSTVKPKPAPPTSPPSKTGDSKTTKSVESKGAGTSKKMTPPPTSPKPTAKGAAAPVKPANPAPKKAAGPAASDKKPKAQPITKSKTASTEKPSAKKPVAKKADANKPLTKKGSATPPSKSDNKRPNSTAKSSPKKLPVKPVTKKRTKPR